MTRHTLRLLYSLTLVLGTLLLISSCGSVASTHGGLTDEAYIVLSAKKEYPGSFVYLHIDKEQPRGIKVVAERHKVLKGTGCPIRPGRHHLRITSEMGATLYEQEIFVSARNTKVITLP